MSANASISSGASVSGSLLNRMSNILVTPGEVFDQVLTSPPTSANWRVPTLLSCLAAILFVQLVGPMPAKPVLGSLVEAHLWNAAWPFVSGLVICLATFFGTFWSAFVLWFIGRQILRVRFSYMKAVEAVGLIASVAMLGMIFTGLLTMVSGNPLTQPSLSLLAGNLEPGSRLGMALEIFNLFHLWAVTLLAIGLSRFSAVSFKETAFWVFGYWIVLRIALIALA